MPSPLVLTATAAIARATPAVAPVVEQVVAPVVTPVLAPVVPSCAGGGSAPANASRGEVRRAVLCLLHRQRALHGLAPLRGNPRLRRAGWSHARDMVVHHYFAHSSRNGAPFDARIRATGYMSNVTRWRVGENLAWGAGARATPRRIVAAWMHSPPHRANILDGRFTEIGIAVVSGAPVSRRLVPAATYATEFGARG